MSNFSWEKTKPILIFLFIAVILWIAFGPVQLGGQTAYVILSGNSMAPDFKIGDLVVARKSSFYEVNQRVVYDNPKIGYVFHRIIDREKNKYILKGDSNDWIDSYYPSPSEIVGKFWYFIPGGGNLIKILREPVYFTLFALIILIILASIFLFQKEKSDRRKRGKNKRKMKPENPSASRDSRQEILLLLGVIAVAALILGGISYSRPLSKTVSYDVPYQHQGEFSYSASDSAGIYDSEKITTGDPVYTRLNCILALEFGYLFSAPEMTDVEEKEFTGTNKVNVKISDADGWKRFKVLVPETSFTGTDAEMWTLLDICRLQALFLEKEQKTETENRKYTLTIAPEINVSGVVNGIPLEDSYRPEISFQIDSDMMRLMEGFEGLNLDQEGSLSKSQEVNNSFLIFGQQLDIEIARRIATITLGISLVGAIFPSWTLIRDWVKSDVSRIQMQYHPLLVDVKQGSPATQGNHYVDVTSFADLIKMAERYGAMILHESRGSYHRYSVQDEQTVYQYMLDVFQGQTLFPAISSFIQSIEIALIEDQLEIYYQPVVLLRDKSIIGVEAFIRWNHPEFGILYPADFISHAEESGLMPKIDGWVTKRACHQLREWGELGLPKIPVSINISPDTIVDADYIKDITSIVLENLCDPALLQIEINRSNQVFQDETIKQHLVQLNELGILLAIDNFATESANQINQVSQMPIQSVKIDRTILQDIQNDINNQRLINAVVQMAKSLQLNVVAQGVESKEQMAALEAQDIEVAQGFFLGAPVQAKEMALLLEKHEIVDAQFTEE